MPPCAYAVALSNSERFVSSIDVAALRRAPRRVKPGDAAADDEESGADSIGHEA